MTCITERIIWVHIIKTDKWTIQQQKVIGQMRVLRNTFKMLAFVNIIWNTIKGRLCTLLVFSNNDISIKNSHYFIHWISHCHFTWIQILVMNITKSHPEMHYLLHIPTSPRKHKKDMAHGKVLRYVKCTIQAWQISHQ